MNEKNIVSIDAVIDKIKIRGYIDCNECDGHYDEYEYDNILYYLEKYKNLQSKIDKAIEYLYEHSQYNDGDGIHYIKEDEYCVDYLLDILKEDK